VSLLRLRGTGVRGRARRLRRSGRAASRELAALSRADGRRAW